ncbi:hypothetical protein PGT21_015622 [Puccinia graminis f. sp. tritici]|uniref:Uncharacterized protein n=1 Tax=Puccinia graminis f. sp. tritici TaxID=56615 RepID=A0A5B0N0P8_PUCGR|nr:hypothetical protein PGT21_015622 [Puccinia graminis f. sp. tritici]
MTTKAVKRVLKAPIKLLLSVTTNCGLCDVGMKCRFLILCNLCQFNLPGLPESSVSNPRNEKLRNPDSCVRPC